MPRIDRAPRPLLRLNSTDFEAFLRGSRRAGRVSVHRKLDAARIAGGEWRVRARHVTARLCAAPRDRGSVRLALRQLAPLLARLAPRLRTRVRIQCGRRRLLCDLARRGGLPWRSAGESRGPLALRARLAATLGEVPPDYATARGLQRQREARVLGFAGIDISQRECWLAPDAARRLHSLRAAAARDGIDLQLVSGFRSATYQTRILERKRVRGEPMAQILTVNAAPGFSEHHSGRAVDLTASGFAPIEQPFERSDAFAWLNAHARQFRLRLSYPRDNPHGIVYEPWHWYFEN